MNSKAKTVKQTSKEYYVLFIFFWISADFLKIGFNTLWITYYKVVLVVSKIDFVGAYPQSWDIRTLTLVRALVLSSCDSSLLRHNKILVMFYWSVHLPFSLIRCETIAYLTGFLHRTTNNYLQKGEIHNVTLWMSLKSLLGLWFWIYIKYNVD